MPTTQTVAPQVDKIADRAARKAEGAIDSTQEMANSTLNSLKDGVTHLRESAPAALSNAAAQVQDLGRRGLDRAREVGADVRDKAQRASDRTVGYIQDEPVKAVLIAAAAGAVVALLARALSSHKPT